MHIDDLRTNRDIPNITDMVGKSIPTLFEKNVLDLLDEDNQENFVQTHELTLSNQTTKAKSFDFLSLVKKCVQSSLSMVKYPDNPQRSTQCVNTWIGLLHDTKKSGNSVKITTFETNLFNFLSSQKIAQNIFLKAAELEFS